MKALLIVSAALALSLAGIAFADPGHKHGSQHSDEYSAGQPGDPKKNFRTVLMTMKETPDGKMVFQPSSLNVRLGEQVRFIITNIGELPHEFVLATVAENAKHALEMRKNPEMEHDDPNNKRLKPKQKVEILWHFTKAGTFEFACLIPGHYESGMLGTITVK